MQFLLALLCALFLTPTLSFSQKLKPGDKLPEIRFISSFGDSLSSNGLKGKKILITFNRYVSCPLCNFRTHELMNVNDSLRSNNLMIISIYESNRETLTEYTSKEQVPFFMVADPDEVLYKKFQVQKSWWKTIKGRFTDYKRKHTGGRKLFKSSYKRDGNINRIGADFLVDENGVIQIVYYGKFAGDHLPIDDILRWVLKK